MPIVHRCNLCHRQLPTGRKCTCYERRRKSDVLDVNKFYNSNDWRKSRELAINHYFGLDIYSLFILNKIENGFTVHHIIPLEDDYSLRNNQSNLIYLTESNHRLIHEQLKKDYYGTIKKLQEIVNYFDKLVIGGGQKCFL